MPEKFGQYFLKDKTVVEKIISLLPPGGNLLEIGPGKGALTYKLALIADNLICVERDPKLAYYMKEKFGGEKLRVITGDILKESGFFDGAPFNIISNLPYGISTDIIYFLAALPAWNTCVLTLQKETAERFTAATGSSGYGRTSVTAGVFFDIHLVFTFSKKCFSPPPKVDAGVLVLQNKNIKAESSQRVDIKEWKNFMNICFFSGRKTLSNNLKRLPDNKMGAGLLECLKIKSNARPQDVAPGQYLELFKKIFPPACRDSNEACCLAPTKGSKP
ncbi:MAG: 16S rRNA (adenine(1518)-N(6)/adenine(1519)-N(6))-dimethyltransferase RsmA [Elusimicrobiota bacterium]|nr:16S rRNA (adenine(1518)-N(6)/adenine(1519)-N(6))-dimethyltransferase RsmA [Elusimicrobiota bacterium]